LLPGNTETHESDVRATLVHLYRYVTVCREKVELRAVDTQAITQP